MLAYKGELEKTTTFKDKVRLQPENVNAGLLNLPCTYRQQILLFTVLTMFLLEKTRNNTWKWQEILPTDLIIVMVNYFPNRRLLIMVQNW